jgi:hypothetical protein
MLDYESLKVMAKSIGRPVRQLLALSPTNDPFYAGVGARRRDAEWFAAIWANHGGVGSHVRRLHYRLISSTTPFLKPDGQPYQNTENDWASLVGASLAARYLDLVPFDGMIDRRNDEPMIFAGNLDADPDEELSVDCELADTEPEVEAIDVPNMPNLPSLFLALDRAVQKFIVEVWVEKSTQNDWLVPLCRRRGVNLVVGAGEQSETRSRELALRAAKYGAPVRIIYLADFDPGGRSMPKGVARKVEFTIAKFNLDVDLQLIPLALTPDQCREYRLPRTPIKDSEKRKDKFEQTFGVGATELDALEALHPGELGRLLEAELNNWLDDGLARRWGRLQSNLDIRFRNIDARVYRNHADEIEALEESFTAITGQVEDIGNLIDEWQAQATGLWHVIATDLAGQRPDLSDVEVPQSQAPGNTDRFALFDSKRDYFTQMDAYNAWRDGDEGSDAA